MNEIKSRFRSQLWGSLRGSKTYSETWTFSFYVLNRNPSNQNLTSYWTHPRPTSLSLRPTPNPSSLPSQEMLCTSIVVLVLRTLPTA